MNDPIKNKKVYFLHIPKTAGTTINTLFSTHFPEDKILTHIESNEVITRPDKKDILSEYQYVSGHYPYPAAQANLTLSDRATIATFRSPEEHIVSHLCWVRLLGEPEHANRLSQHDSNIQSIVKHLKTVDLSDPDQIPALIDWLEENNFFLFHNTQTRYLCGGKKNPSLTENQIQTALTNLEEIDFVGTVERLNEFILLLISTLDINTTNNMPKRENTNNNKFGMDSNNKALITALNPLIKYDKIIYDKAREIFIDKFHNFLASIEKSQHSRFTTTNLNDLANIVTSFQQPR